MVLFFMVGLLIICCILVIPITTGILNYCVEFSQCHYWITLLMTGHSYYNYSLAVHCDMEDQVEQGWDTGMGDT